MDTACVTVCPVDCFYQPKQPSDDLPNQLYISVDECIDCGACLPECPWEAIFEGGDVPELFADDTPLNARCDPERDKFETAKHTEKERPSAEQIAANKQKWGM
jgi:ferredoxin